MPTFLHVGCGASYKDQTTPEFARAEWSEIRLDIDPAGRPDVVSDMCDMAAVASGSVEAVFSSHNIEHLYAHQVDAALREFRRVLKADGCLVIRCPDLQAVAALVADDRLHEPAYQSESGPISPHDMIYGFGRDIAAGNAFMAHRCGFTARSLVAALREAGFVGVGVRQRSYELRAVATPRTVANAAVRALLDAHYP